MNKIIKISLAGFLGMFVLAFATDTNAQKRTSPPRVCGDPSAACARRAEFSEVDLPFEYSGNAIVAESAPFYVAIVKSVKVVVNSDQCEKDPVDFSVRNLQYNFPKNKAFIARGCYSIENNFYTNIGQDVIALAIFAGTTKAQADVFLKKLKATQNLETKGAYLKKITTGFNGT